MTNRDGGLDFHGIKSSEGDTAALSRGVCGCWWVAHTQAHTYPCACWELGQDRGPCMNCVLTHADRLATDGDVWGREGGCLCCRKFCPLSLKRGRGRHPPSFLSRFLQPITHPFLLFPKTIQQGTLRLTPYYLCGTAAGLNPIGLDSGTEMRAKTFC